MGLSWSQTVGTGGSKGRHLNDRLGFVTGLNYRKDRGMTVKELLEKNLFTLINEGQNSDQVITTPYCCDLLSVAMGKAPSGAVWVTVMANVNTLAVAALADVACIILAEGVLADEQTLKKAKEQGITVLSASEPVFETALKVQHLLNA